MNSIQNTLPPCKYFLKGDISGIQEFIFNVKSSGAAKSLKGRSFFVQVLSLVGIEMVKYAFKEENVFQFYNGGGNFYLFIKEGEKEVVRTVQKEIDEFCKQLNFHLTLSVIDVNGRDIEQNFGALWKEINEAASKNKLEKFSQTLSAFEKYPYKVLEKNRWADFTKFLFQLEQRGKYGITRLDNKDLTNNQSNQFMVGARGATVLNYQFTEGDLDIKDIVLTLPRWSDFLIDENRVMLEKERRKKEYPAFVKASEYKDGILSAKEQEDQYKFPYPDMIIDFSYLADFAKERTGTGKLGIVKMDVDHLGQLFNYLGYHTAKQVSVALTTFFGSTIQTLLQEEMTVMVNTDTSTQYKDNIYTIFSGGDDCFFCWCLGCYFTMDAAYSSGF